MARLLADVNFPKPTVLKLRKLGHEVRTVQEEVGTSEPDEPLTDEEVIAMAVAQRRAVLTQDVHDFECLHEDKPAHKGIVISKPYTDFKRQAKDIHECLKECTRLAGQLLYVPPRPTDQKDDVHD